MRGTRACMCKLAAESKYGRVLFHVFSLNRNPEINHNSEPADRTVDWFSLPSATSFDRDIFPVNQTNEGAGGRRRGGGGKSKLFPFVSLLAVAILVSPSLLQLSRLLLFSPLFSHRFFSFSFLLRSRRLKYLTERELFRSLARGRDSAPTICREAGC